jgi:hypothetical protein
METTGYFVSGESIFFKAEGRKREVQVILPASLAEKFNVVSKSIPDSLSEEWGGYHILWINNIGLEGKLDGAAVTAGEFYEIQFSRPQSKISSEFLLVYWDGQAIQPIAASNYAIIPGDTVAVRMQLVDPPIGWGVK